MRTPPAIRSVTALLCSDCTLRCAYCYQRPGGSLRMSWPVLRASLDVALTSPVRPVTIEFSGGEPLLAFPMLRRALRYAERSGNDAGVRYVLTTNGTLLDPATLAVLEEHRFEVRLTFHAVPGAQDPSGRGIFRHLDRVLDRLQVEHAALWRDRLHVAVTVGICEVPALADSIEYLVAKGVRHVGMAAAFGQARWRAGDIDRIERQFARITALMRRERARTGRLPLPLYRKRDGETGSSSGEDPPCSGASGQAIAIDPTGQAYGCVMLAGTRPVTPDRVRATAARPHGAAPALVVNRGSPLWRFQLGDVRDAAFSRRLRTYSPAVLRSGIFERRREQYSSYGRCGDCRFIDRCSVRTHRTRTRCPTSSARSTGSRLASASAFPKSRASGSSSRAARRCLSSSASFSNTHHEPGGH
jgi:uncharacterized protein